jgi:CheY-like chemotaxis protein
MAPASRRRTDGCRILLVEDSDDLRLLMQMALENEGYHVASAPSAEEGMRLVEGRRYDLVVTDYNLPGNSGGWLLQQASNRKLLRGAATLLVTANPHAPELAAHTEVIAKPLDFDAFLPQIREILAAVVEATRGGAVAPATRVELVLYVSPKSIACSRALKVMRDLLRAYDTRQIDFRVCDTAADPNAAARDRIIFTPTLVKRSPPPNVWVLGDLSNADVVTDLLHMSGVSPATTT